MLSLQTPMEQHMAKTVIEEWQLGCTMTPQKNTMSVIAQIASSDFLAPTYDYCIIP